MKYIIMCGGTYRKWGKPKQLTEFMGEQLAARTVRLLRECGATDIAISSDDERFQSGQFGVEVLRHDNGYALGNGGEEGFWVDGFCPVDGPACYIFGDVVFSPAAVRKIVETETDSIQFFASSPPFAKEYAKKYAEPFAFKVADQARFRAAVDFVRANASTGIFCRHPVAWELWQVINGWNVRDINYGEYAVINDYTCDVDVPEDARRIEEAMCR